MPPSAGKIVRCSGRRAQQLKPLILGWFKANARFVSRCRRISCDDATYWYNERASVSGLAGGAWIKNAAALEEYAFIRGKRRRRHHRADLWLVLAGREFFIEAKQVWCNLDKWGTGQTKYARARLKRIRAFVGGRKQVGHALNAARGWSKARKTAVVVVFIVVDFRDDEHSKAHVIARERIRQLQDDLAKLKATRRRRQRRRTAAAQVVARWFNWHAPPRAGNRLYPGVFLLAHVLPETRLTT